MTNTNQLLTNELALMDKSFSKLEQSFEQCKEISLDKKLTKEEEIAFEALTARFSRLREYLLQRIFRTVDVIELDDSGTLRDRINRAEKKGWISDADDFIEIRTLRNIIAHEYDDEEIIVIYQKVMQFIPLLMQACENINGYIKQKAYI